MKPLSAAQVKRLRFAELLAVGTEQTEAAAQAGYARGNGLAVTACRMKEHPEVVAHLAKLRAAAEADAVAKKEELERILTEDVRASFADFLDAEGNLDRKKLKTLGRRLKAVTFTDKGGVRLELQDKHGAIGLLCKLGGHFKAEKVEQKVSVDESQFPPGFLQWAKDNMGAKEGGAA